jgi:hypothetical protein
MRGITGIRTGCKSALTPGTHKAAGPRATLALLTWEVARLADWLDDPSGELDFIEPCLVFEYVERDEEKLRLRVWFDLELRPDWATKSFAGDRDVSVELTVSDDELRAAAAELRRELESYPERP